MISIEQLIEKAAKNAKMHKNRMVIISQMVAEIYVSKEEGQKILMAFLKMAGESLPTPVVRTLSTTSRAAVYNEVEANTKSTADCPTCGGNSIAAYIPTIEEQEEEGEKERTIESVEPLPPFDLAFFLDNIASGDDFKNKDIVDYLKTKGMKYDLPRKGFLPKATLIERLKKEYIK